MLYVKFVHVVLKKYPIKSLLKKLCIQIISIIKIMLKNYYLIVILKNYHAIVV